MTLNRASRDTAAKVSHMHRARADASEPVSSAPSLHAGTTRASELSLSIRGMRESGDLDAAERAATEALSQFSSSLTLLLEYARIAYQRGAWEQAIDRLRLAEQSCETKLPERMITLKALCYAQLGCHAGYVHSLGLQDSPLVPWTKRKSSRDGGDSDRMEILNNRICDERYCTFLIWREKSFRSIDLGTQGIAFEKLYSREKLRNIRLLRRKLWPLIRHATPDFIGRSKTENKVNACYFGHIDKGLEGKGFGSRESDFLRICDILLQFNTISLDYIEYHYNIDCNILPIPLNYQKRLDNLVDNTKSFVDLCAQHGIDTATPRRFLKNAYALIDFLKRITPVICHGDVHLDNLGFVGDSQVLVDWDSWGKAPIGSDLSRILFNKRALDNGIIHSAIEYYSREAASLHPQDEISLSIFINIAVFQLHEIAKGNKTGLNSFNLMIRIMEEILDRQASVAARI